MTQQFHSWVYIQKTPYYFEKIVHSNVHSSTVYNCQAMEATEVSINRGMDKEDVIYNGILLSNTKEGNFAICSNMDGLRGHYAK